jgi:hypothetical protein
MNVHNDEHMVLFINMNRKFREMESYFQEEESFKTLVKLKNWSKAVHGHL